MNLPPNAELHDYSPTPVSFRKAVIDGLGKAQKTLPCQFFYDAEGSRLFEAICGLPEYYPTRTELAILEAIGPELGERVGPAVRLIEFGCGSSRKVVAVLRDMDVSTYVPVDISRSALEHLIRDVTRRFADLDVQAVCADFTESFDVPGDDRERTVGFYPGSTIDNFAPSAAERFLSGLRPLLGPGGMIIVGVDLVKSVEVIENAYNDAAGVTATFNRNLLERINRELDGSFRPERFEHYAFFNSEESRVEMHLVSRAPQSVEIGGMAFEFAQGETIHTENSYKYSLDAFRALARRAGYRPLEAWTDENRLFSVHLLRVTS